MSEFIELGNGMNETLLLYLNQFNTNELDTVFEVASTSYFRSLPFMLVVWALWFRAGTEAEKTARREMLTGVLLVAIPIIGITRFLANTLPFSARPLHTEDLDILVRNGQDLKLLDGWNSLPSDHASLFFGLATMIFLIDRRFGGFLFVWAAVVVCLPRVITGLHWPSDILAGAFLGIFLGAVLLAPVSEGLRRFRIIPFLERHEAYAYPLLFFVTYEVAQMFKLSRTIVYSLIA